jgi:hypothetical protein
VHPDFYKELIRQRHADLDREASRTRLAASLPLERRLRRRASSKPNAVRLTIQTRLRIELLGRIDRGLLGIEARVARALLNATPADPAASDGI